MPHNKKKIGAAKNMEHSNIEKCDARQSKDGQTEREEDTVKHVGVDKYTGEESRVTQTNTKEFRTTNDGHELENQILPSEKKQAT